MKFNFVHETRFRAKTTFTNVKKWYKFHKDTGQLPYALVFALVIFTPFEEFILRWILLPSPVVGLLRYIPELLLYYTCGKLFYQRIKNGEPLKKTPIEPLFIAFLISFIISIVANGASVPGSVSRLRINWRYLSIYYILVNIEISTKQVWDILETIKKIGLIQSVIASIQMFLPSSLTQFLFTREVRFGDALAEKGASIGTFGDNAVLSALILVINIVWITFFYSHSQSWVPTGPEGWKILLIYLATFASKKRASLVVALLIPVIVLMFLKRKKDVAKLVWVGTLLAFVLAAGLSLMPVEPTVGSSNDGEKKDMASYFVAIFTPEYWQHNAENSRGWMIFTICRTTWNTASIFGFGPEPGAVKRKILTQLSDPEDQARIERNLGVYEDPYWFALLGYYGIVGLILFVAIYHRLYLSAKWLIKNSTCREYKVLGVIFCAMMIITYIYTFIERILVFRPFTLYFWVLAGLVINACDVEKQKQKRISAQSKKDELE